MLAMVKQISAVKFASQSWISLIAVGVSDPYPQGLIVRYDFFVHIIILRRYRYFSIY